MKILIRADSSLNIGTGHITRCLTLGFHLKKLGLNVAFVSRILDGNIISLVEEKQFKVIKLSSPMGPIEGSQYDKMRGVPIQTEINEIQNVLDLEIPDWVIVDHYGLDITWEKSIRNRGVKLLSLDDLLRNHNCNALLDQNYHSKRTTYNHLLPSTSKIFVGPEYALLNPDFMKLPHRKRNFEKIQNILVFFGGTDPNGETLKFIRGTTNLTQFNFEIVIGKNNPFLEEIKNTCSGLPNFNLHIQIDTMAKLINNSDLYFGSGGTITWERCSLGLPGICVSVAENQSEVSRILGVKMVHEYLGESNKLTGEGYRNSLLNLVKDSGRLALYSSNSLNLKVGTKISEVLELFK